MGTKNDRIFIAQMDETDLDSMSARIKKMIEHAYEETKDIQADIKEIVPEYKEQKKNTTT